jgi:hypothetical protein
VILRRECLALAERQGTTAALMIGHRLMGTSLCFTLEKSQKRADRLTQWRDRDAHAKAQRRRADIVAKTGREEAMLGRGHSGYLAVLTLHSLTPTVR